MNTRKVREIIRLYKINFQYISSEEIYKWTAVKCFQDNWNIETDDFKTMLENSLKQTKNLLDSRRYLPMINLLRIAEKQPEAVRNEFRLLFDEQNGLIKRIEDFSNNIRVLYHHDFPDKKDFQDLRAVVVYLACNFPDRYYFYKFRMFSEFVKLIDYPYRPIMGRIGNIPQYLTICELLKAEIIKDNELLELHRTRLTEKEYHDESFNILTQDIIYAAVNHLDKFQQTEVQESALSRLVKVDLSVSGTSAPVLLKGQVINFLEREKENKRIGDLGELLVLQYEQDKLTKFGIKKLPEHKSALEGDGLGYDILSYNSRGEEIYIEVKTTTHEYSTPFYITRNELEKSKTAGSKFFLYRLYSYDDTLNCAKYYERIGDLTDLCENPVLYRAVIEASE